MICLSSGVCSSHACVTPLTAGNQSVVPNTTYVVGHGETHVSLIYTVDFLSQETQQESELKRWLAARL